MKFNLPFTYAQISKVNPRSEFHGEEKELAMDIKVSITADVAVLDQFCDEDIKPNFMAVMHDYNGMAFNSGLEELIFNNVFDDHKLGISNSGAFTEKESQYFPNVRLKKFRVKPKSHNLIELTFTVQLSPIEKDIAFLNMAMLRPCYISVEAPTVEQEKLF